jgi:predicted nucleotide-binding protein
MNTERKLDLLQQQIDEAKDGTPDDFSLWRQKTGVVLRNVLGDANPLYASFTSVQYSLSIFSENTPQTVFDQARIRGVKQAIAILKAAKTEVELTGGIPERGEGPASTGDRIFVVHGHNEARKHEVARVLRGLTGNEPVILHEQASQGRTIIEKFEDHAADVAFAVVIATGDDIGRAASGTEEHPRARQNVILELGFFFGALGRARVALVYEEGVERPSDIDGIIRIPLDEAGGWKLLLARELEGSGVGIDWSALR